jgi:CheY-like chemotaxis protein
MSGDTPEFRALLRRLRQQSDEEADSYLTELATACASAAESYNSSLQHMQRVIDAYMSGRRGDAVLREITQQVTNAERDVAKLRALLAQYESQLQRQKAMQRGIETVVGT